MNSLIPKPKHQNHKNYKRPLTRLKEKANREVSHSFFDQNKFNIDKIDIDQGYYPHSSS